jgi:RNA recognition motif-containing protein
LDKTQEFLVKSKELFLSKSLLLFLGNIPKDTREKDLERFFKNYGHLRDVLVKPGYGFVEFEDPR